MTSKGKRGCLGLITARGGSKGVSNKNIRPLCGKPVLAYTIQVANACEEIDDVMVSTDSPDIRNLAIQLGAEAPFLRPAHLATDVSKQEDAVVHAMQWCQNNNRQYEYLCLLEPTAPLRSVETLRRGFSLLRDRPEAPAVFSVAPVSVPPAKCGIINLDGTLEEFFSPDRSLLNRQEYPQYFKLSNLCVIIRWNEFLQCGNFLANGRALALPVDPVEATDVDAPLDFLVAEMLMSRGLGSEALVGQEVNGK